VVRFYGDKGKKSAETGLLEKKIIIIIKKKKKGSSGCA
jgi:hypothetical protein